jgi:hypothetical protein
LAAQLRLGLLPERRSRIGANHNSDLVGYGSDLTYIRIRFAHPKAQIHKEEAMIRRQQTDRKNCGRCGKEFHSHEAMREHEKNCASQWQI